MSRSILFVIYANPGAYPPVENAVRLLAARGVRMRVLGIEQAQTAALAFEAPAGVVVELLEPAAPGWRQKLQFMRFCLRVLVLAATQRPDYVYASDPMSAPAALLAAWAARLPVVYHEHDAPPSDPRHGTGFMRLVRRARDRMVRDAELVIVPQAARARELEALRGGAVLCVWNTPLEADARPVPEPLQALHLLYAGSLVPERVPRTVLEALRELPDVHLDVIGYATAGTPGYADELRAAAGSLGLDDRVHFVGPLPRAQLLRHARRCSVGLSLVPMAAVDPNLRSMVGASNKAFDYLACGLPLLVSDLPDWRDMYVSPGLAVTCDPERTASIVAALREYLDDPARRIRMGEAGRRRILTDWNYERQFAPVLSHLTGVASAGRALAGVEPVATEHV